MKPNMCISNIMLQYIFDMSDVKCSAESSNGERWRRIFSLICLVFSRRFSNKNQQSIGTKKLEARHESTIKSEKYYIVIVHMYINTRVMFSPY